MAIQFVMWGEKKEGILEGSDLPPGCLDGREGRGRMEWEDDDLHMLEIELAWKNIFPMESCYFPRSSFALPEGYK